MWRQQQCTSDAPHWLWIAPASCTPTLRHSQFPVFKHTANVYKRRKTNCKLYLTLSKRFLLHQTGPDAPWACCAMTYRLIPYSQVLVILHSTAQQPTPENYSWPYEYWHIWLHPAYEARGWICIRSEMYSQFGGREEPELSSQISPECTNVWVVPDHQLFSHHSDKTLKSVQKQFRFINSFALFYVDIFTHLFYSSANHSFPSLQGWVCELHKSSISSSSEMETAAHSGKVG